MLVPCRASSPRTPKCRTGHSVVLFTPRHTCGRGGYSAVTLLPIQLVLRTDSRLLSEQAFERCKKAPHISHLPLSRIAHPHGNCGRRWIGWAWQPEGYSCTIRVMPHLMPHSIGAPPQETYEECRNMFRVASPCSAGVVTYSCMLACSPCNVPARTPLCENTQGRPC